MGEQKCSYKIGETVIYKPTWDGRGYARVLPAYGLLGLALRQVSPSNSANENIFRLPIPAGAGHSYLGEKRTFLLCVDTHVRPVTTLISEITLSRLEVWV